MPNSVPDSTETQRYEEGGIAFTVHSPMPGLLIAYAPPHAASVDRLVLPQHLICGRHASCELYISDRRLSSRHFAIHIRDNVPVLDDLGSTNGTFVDGERVVGPVKLIETAVIRCGETVLVYHPDVAPLLKPAPFDRCGLAGRFHTGALLYSLKEASLSSNHLLIAGPSGTGKELAARAFAEMAHMDANRPNFLIYNAAKFASREEATATLFGVAARVFSNVDARAGLIESADGGTLFLDELHNLPIDAQRALLRVIEDGEVTRLGETKGRRVQVRFVIASNAPGLSYGLAEDLFARLRLVTLPSLNDRIADVPSIFVSLLQDVLKLKQHTAMDILPLLSGDHFESLCLEDYTAGNIRILRDLADRLATRLLLEKDPSKAAADVFGERFQNNPVVRRSVARQKEAPSSRYLQHKALIIETFHRCDRNVAATTRALKQSGFACSRRWLAIFLEDWGEKAR